MNKNIIILGSTGSIGTSTLNIIRRNKKKFNIKLLTANNNIKKILSQSIEFKVNKIVIQNKKKYIKFENQFKRNKIQVFFDLEKALKSINKKVHYTINAISGIDGLEPTIKIIKYTKNIAIANKESIICGWKFIKNTLKKNKTNFIPIDSEHFSIWSLIKNEKKKNIKKIYLTASGGPFLYKKLLNVKNVKAKLALKHPNWNMGKKISINSATMMNKIFELIEAKKIFNLDINKFDIIIHPKSYIHAVVHFNNGLVKFLTHDTNMEVPIMNSLYLNNESFIYNDNKLNFEILNGINFINPDKKKFPLLNLIKIIPIKNGYFETILITINDELVMRYLRGEINYFSLNNNLLNMIKKPYFTKYYQSSPNNINDIKNMVNKVKNYLNKYFLTK
jgi:1-deoxy-D-xylulose-5-phosphate reductoisomerase